MKVEIVYNEEEKRMTERCENAIEMTWVSYIENLIASHEGIIQPSYEEIQKIKVDLFG